MEKDRLQKITEAGQFNDWNYKVLAGNASLLDARIIVVGEIHRDRHVRENRFFGIKHFYWTWSESRKHVRELIETQAKAGDVLLRESHRRGRVYSWKKSHEEFHTPIGVTTLGWDNMWLNHIDGYWQWRSRRAFVRGDKEKEGYYDRKMSWSAYRRNKSLHRTILDVAKDLQEGQRLWVVAGQWHVNNNYELRLLLQDYSHIIIASRPFNDENKKIWEKRERTWLIP